MAATPSLHTLLASWRTAVAGTTHPQPPAYDGPDVALSGFTEKSGEAGPGVAFVARVRTGTDGHPYIADALARGASLILAQRPAAEVGVVVPPGAVYLTVADTAEALAWLAAAAEGFPSQQLAVIGVTGTDGKTTTANILFSILRAAGFRAGLLSTIRAVIGDEEEPLALHVTTPEAPAVQRYLRRMADAGLTHVVLETTSHALAQSRVAAVAFDVAVVTNITHEHLDYHGSYDAYFAAKRRLFAALLDDPLALPAAPHKAATPKTAVLNRDDASFAPLADFLRGQPARVLTYGLEDLTQRRNRRFRRLHRLKRRGLRKERKGRKGRKGAFSWRSWRPLRSWREPLNLRNLRLLPSDVTAGDVVYGPAATRLGLRLPGAPGLAVTTPLVGAFNVYNMLAASAAGVVLGVAPAAVVAGLAGVGQLSGRMERIDRGQPFLVVVDFAHTPNALERAIAAARELGARGPWPLAPRVIAVFGSAGKRDVAKRRLMAEIAARSADLTVLTAEDPRTESLDAILATMAAAAESAGGVEGQTFWRVPDRGRAIYFALSLARPGDVVLICGKGHEQSMAFGTTEYPWDDRRATEAALEAFLAGRPMPDLGLPTYSNE